MSSYRRGRARRRPRLAGFRPAPRPRASTAMISVPSAERQRLLDRLGQRAAAPSASTLRRSMTISMLCLIRWSSFRSSVSAHDLAIDAGADEAALEHVGEEVLVLALLAADDRGEDEEARPLRQGQDAADDLLARLGRDRPAALRAVALADAGVEHAQVVVNLGDGADGRARVAAGGLLLDADGRRQAAEVVDVGLRQLAEELAGVARQRLDVAPLALGVERVEGQRDFAGAADAGEDDELVARQVEVDVAEVVFAGPADDDGLRFHVSVESRPEKTEGRPQLVYTRQLRAVSRAPGGFAPVEGTNFLPQAATTRRTKDVTPA